MARIVRDLNDFIQEIRLLTDDNRHIATYRGHSNRSEYKLSPSVFRKPSHRAAEKNIIREIVALHPSEFTGDNTTLERLVRMQHFSLPTRLLDVTANPLVALYFTCKSHPTKTGEVIAFRIPKRRVKYFDSDTASCLANLANLSSSEKGAILLYDDMEELNQSNDALRLLHFIKAEKPYFLPKIEPDDLRSVIYVKAKQSNRRILAQQGAFLLFGLTRELTESNKHDIEINRIPVAAKAKRHILGELDSISINESTLFPEIETAARYLMKKLEPDQ